MKTKVKKKKLRSRQRKIRHVFKGTAIRHMTDFEAEILKIEGNRIRSWKHSKKITELEITAVYICVKYFWKINARYFLFWLGSRKTQKIVVPTVIIRITHIKQKLCLY